MAGWLALALAEAAVGALLEIGGLVLVGALTAAVAVLPRIWSRAGTDALAYRRRLTTRRAVVGDRLGLEVEVWNQRALPLPWVSADDLVADGVNIRERPELEFDDESLFRRVLRNAWALAWYERVTRRFTIEADRRGHFTFGPVRLALRDILGREVGRETRDLADSLTVTPGTVAVRAGDHPSAPMGERRARSGLTHDPALFSGVRPFQPGDPLRRIHWRATARVGRPVSRRYEPARAREVILAVDVQTIDGPYWEMSWDDDAFEGLCVAAASLVRARLADGDAVGLAASGFSGSTQWVAWVPPRAGLGQLAACADALARIGPVSSRPYDYLLSWLSRRAPAGSTILALTTRDPTSVLPVLRRLGRSGFDIEVATLGRQGAVAASALRDRGVPISAFELRPDWQRADSLQRVG